MPADDFTNPAVVYGRHIREVLLQPQYEPIQAPEQIAILLAATAGVLDGIPLDEVSHVKKKIIEIFSKRLPKLHKRIQFLFSIRLVLLSIMNN